MVGGMILVSGGFDPLHNGHIRMIKAAREYGPVIVALNSDEWLIRKKGRRWLPWFARREVVAAIRGVDAVVMVDDTDETVCEALLRHRPEYFGNGGDRVKDNTPELELCRALDIEPVFFLGGGKVSSSSEFEP
jgi:D-beta-D-heptose 7-phosphate kinase/D-beta-D-heptose 1-phosphate adenosyltransferase